jgi:hypothetical protein
VNADGLPERPPCMSRREWQMWRLANETLTSAGHRALSPCVDCSPEFAGEMADEDRCSLQVAVRRRLGLEHGG